MFYKVKISHVYHTLDVKVQMLCRQDTKKLFWE